jgi:hypothetical protein
VALLFGVACSDDSPTDEPCDGTRVPAYVVTVAAEDGPLPADLVITARWGGGEESFSLAEGPLGNEERIMFCTDSYAGGDGLGGAGGSGGGNGGEHQGTEREVTTLVCDLWADTAVTFEMTALGYVHEPQELKLSHNSCGDVATAEVQALLVHPELEE